MITGLQIWSNTWNSHCVKRVCVQSLSGSYLPAFGLNTDRSSHLRCSVRKSVLGNFAKFTGKNLCQSLFFNKVATLFKKQTLAQLFSCEFCKSSKKTFFTEQLRATASVWRFTILIEDLEYHSHLFFSHVSSFGGKLLTTCYMRTK